MSTKNLNHKQMEYCFLLGRNPLVSIAEIVAKLGNSYQYERSGDRLLMVEGALLNTSGLIKELGGTIKIMAIEAALSENTADDLFHYLTSSEINKAERITFGLSHFGLSGFDLKKVGLTAKKLLVTNGFKVRLVADDRELSSASILNNKLIDNGIDLNIIEHRSRNLLARTEAIQDIKGLSRRDYGRPARDDHSGMLPPKLALILINLAGGQKNRNILDPFCGSGTVLTEALGLGITDIFGSDNSQKAIDDSESNILWTLKEIGLSDSEIDADLFVLSADQLEQKIKQNSIDLIATEPFLGPQRGLFKASEVAKKLENLYSDFLVSADKVCKKGARLAMVWPIFASNNKRVYLKPSLGNWQNISYIPEHLITNEDGSELSPQGRAIYHRPDQKVWREIVVLQK